MYSNNKNGLLPARLTCGPSSRPGDECHPEVKADGYVDNLAEAVDLLLKYMDK